MINRNLVCSILLKDRDNILRRIFDIEGDKPNDPSIYIVKMNHKNTEVQKTDDEMRKFCLQHSHHSRKDNLGLVQVHFKRNGRRFGQRKQAPLDNEGALMKHYHFNFDDAQNYPEKVAEKYDIILKINPEYFSDYSFMFFTEKNRLENYVSQRKLTILHIYNIPIKNVEKFNLAILIQSEKLLNIQKTIP